MGWILGVRANVQTHRLVVKATAVVLTALSLSSCAPNQMSGMPTKLQTRLTDTNVPSSATGLSEADYRRRVQILADDRFEGRGPGTEKGEAAAEWIASEMRRIGLKPGNHGSFFQDVPAASIALDPAQSKFEITGPDGTRALKFADEVAYWSPRFDRKRQTVTNSDLVFVGYGVVAPETKWNDYAGVDVHGKTVVLLINDPGFSTHDDTLFKGRAMTYYGRWTYKFEEAARQGAAAVIIVHETEPAAYGWQVVRNSNSGRKLYLDRANGNSDLSTVHSWIQTSVARGLFARAGLDFEAQKRAANTRGFKPIPMKGLKLNATTVSDVAHMKTRNVIGIVKGTKRPNEYVLYTAHWDHLGIKPDAPGTDKIHNGAVDNATGVSAILNIGSAFASARKPPRRSVMFAAVTLEEQGLLGSAYLAQSPPVPLNHIVAGMNFDALLPQGPSKNMIVVGSGASEIENILANVLVSQNRVASPDPTPEHGSFYRSDHISLAKKGVPMLYAGGGDDLIDGGIDKGKALSDDYREHRYHQPSDEYDSHWDVSGPMLDIAAMYQVGREIADGSQWPNWFKGNEFRELRDKSKGDRMSASDDEPKVGRRHHRQHHHDRGHRHRHKHRHH